MNKLLSILILCITTGWLMANEPSISAEFTRRNAFVGDKVTLEVRVYHDASYQVEPYEPPDKLGDASVLSHQWLPAQHEKGAAQPFSLLKIDLAWYRHGEFKVPPIEIQLKSQADETLLSTPELTMEIIEMLSEEDMDAAPAKGQVALEVPPLWPWLLGLFVVAAGLIALILYFLLRRKKVVVEPPPPPPKPPYEEAIEALNNLTAGSLLKEGQVKAFYVEVNAIVRHYYARLYNICAEEMTSFEMEEWLEEEAHRLPGELFYLNRAFQESCDRVKFAKHDPVEAENKETTNRAYQIVEVLKPQAILEGGTHVAAS